MVPLSFFFFVKKLISDITTLFNEQLGTPTILVNNAGLMIGKSILELSPDEIER